MDVVWDNCTQYEVDELETFQIEAARIVTGATKLVSIDITVFRLDGRRYLLDV